MAEYLIQGTTLVAIGDAIRAGLSSLEPTTHTAKIDSAYDAGDGRLTGVEVFYREFADAQGAYGEALQEPTGDVVVKYEYKPDNNGEIALVIYKTDPNYPNPDLRDQFFYQGRATINGVVYDKWRKISDTSLPEGQDYGDYDALYTWESVGKQYWYTNIITEATISPLDMPAKIEEIAAQGSSVNIVGSLTVTPTTSRQVFDALDEGAAGYAAVIVEAMPTTSPDAKGIEYYGINNASGDYVVVQMGYVQPTAGYMEAGASTYDYPVTTDIPVKDNNDISVSGSTITIPAGYYNDTTLTVSGGTEDLETELSAQESLITNIKTSLANKAAGGGGAALNTCTARITVSGDVEAGLYGCSFTCYENGALQANTVSDLSHVLGWSDYFVQNALCGSAFSIIVDNEYIGLYVDQVQINGEPVAITKTIAGQYVIISGALPQVLNSSEAEIMIIYA